MISLIKYRVLTAATSLLAITASLVAQEQVHGRKYKPPPDITHIVVTVEKGFNSKPMPNAAVIFYSTKDGKDNGNLEVKTDPDGRAILDLIEKGSHVRIQVIANGFATYAEEFDIPADTKEVLVKLQRPKSQVSSYEDDGNKAAPTQAGTQEHAKPTPPPQPPSTPPAGPPQ